MEGVPDDIVRGVLSFLETREAVQSSVIGRSWRNLWDSLPVVSINSDSFSYYNSFSNFVSSVLDRRSAAAPLTFCNFWFDISNPIYSSHPSSADSHHLYEPLVRRFIRHVTSHGVKNLSLFFPRIVDDLPLLFSCNTLEHLRLHQLVILPSFLGVAFLTTMHLVKCSFLTDGDASFEPHPQGFFDPFRDFLHLTDLSITDCRFPSQVQIFEISSPQLTNLTISNMEHDRNLSPDCKIVLSSPRIKTFDFTESHVFQFFVPGLPSIERVYLDVAHIHYLFGNNQVAKEGFLTRLIDMFRAVGNIAMKVTLSFETIRILSLCPGDLLQQPSPFTGMERLRVKVPHEHYANRITIPVNVLLFLLNGTPAIDFEILRL